MTVSASADSKFKLSKGVFQSFIGVELVEQPSNQYFQVSFGSAPFHPEVYVGSSQILPSDPILSHTSLCHF